MQPQDINKEFENHWKKQPLLDRILQQKTTAREWFIRGSTHSLEYINNELIKRNKSR